MNWKERIQRTGKILAYIVHKIGGEILSKEYSLSLRFRHFTYSPWFEDWFLKEYRKIMHHTVVDEDRCYMIYKFCQHCSHLDGDFAECGVFKGGTAFLMAGILKADSANEKSLHLFDTFAGMPAMANQDKSLHKQGDFKDTSLRTVKEYLQDFPFIVFHPGLIPGSLETSKGKRFSFVHIDTDLYQTAVDCCEFFYKRMVKGGVMIFDDYGFFRYKFSEKKAVDEYFNDKPERPISLGTGQCFVIKL